MFFCAVAHLLECEPVSDEIVAPSGPTSPAARFRGRDMTMTIPEALNLTYLEAQYQRYQSDPQSVTREWQVFFQGFEIGLQHYPGGPPAPGSTAEARIAELIHRYRDMGHLLACMDPLSACPNTHPLLEPAAFGLEAQDFERTFATPQFSFSSHTSLKEILQILKQTYCHAVGVEYMHLQDPDERRWLQERMEPVRNRPRLDAEAQRRILLKLTQSAVLEQFFNKRYLAVTRFSLEGGDGIIPMLDALLRRLSELGAREVVVGMAHRGRLNVQVNVLGKALEEILAEFEHCYDSNDVMGSGDVKYHNGYMADLDLETIGTLRALLVNNPSHLEAVDPVVEGIVRARQDLFGANARHGVVPILIHGDAAFAGQGIVAETLNMSQLNGYATGGTIHVVINNQIGYTTLPEDARSTRYATDMAKMLMVPIFHVHGENPEALVHVIRLAADYRHAFAKDVVVDVVCYRRYGHNEGDEPYFTQPQMYDRIRERPSPHRIYADQLIENGTVTPQEVVRLENEALAFYEAAYAEVHGSACPFPQPRFYEAADKYHGRYSHAAAATSVDAAKLRDLARRLYVLPEKFQPFAKIKTLLQRRLETVEKGAEIDWGNAEHLAFASLLAEGVPIRLSGQDSGRGTFSHRQSVLFDRQSGEPYVPLNQLGSKAAAYMVYNSLLAEAAVMGFEYGYAVTRPEALTLWEAQFGDFANNAQGVIDLFIAAGEAKWQRLCGLVLLLPHGWEGLGPEHSSARLERFLQLCADDNMQVCDLSTPANYFHLLRRQAKSPWRKPLVLMTPKSLLRHPQAVSTLADLSAGLFRPVTDDPQPPETAHKVLLCSGKIYYQLAQRRQELNDRKSAIVRLEQFYPFPEEAFTKIIDRYAKAEEWLWVQEAPRNMGAWTFVKEHVEPLIGKKMSYVGRAPAAAPATGMPHLYKKQQAAISDEALGPLPAGTISA
jgi:2-oxoglutarate dehydrogenase E1 component